MEGDDKYKKEGRAWGCSGGDGSKGFSLESGSAGGK